MKTKFMKIKIFFVSLALLITNCVTVFASSTEDQRTHIDHEGSENCIYSCTHTINTYSSVSGTDVLEEKETKQSAHIEHEDSENCIYSCEHPVNNYSSADIWSKEKVENFSREYQEVSSDAEMAALMSKYSGITYTEDDLKEMRISAKNLQLEMIDSDFIKDYKEVSSDAEMAAFMSKYSGITYTEDDLKEMRSTITALPENSYETQAFCDHVYWAVCQGNHSTPNDKCVVARCERIAWCTYGCGSSTTVITECEEHLWSEGWCGRTCTRCKDVEMFHDPGGCWYCS